MVTLDSINLKIAKLQKQADSPAHTRTTPEVFTASGSRYQAINPYLNFLDAGQQRPS